MRLTKAVIKQQRNNDETDDACHFTERKKEAF